MIATQNMAQHQSPHFHKKKKKKSTASFFILPAAHSLDFAFNNSTGVHVKTQNHTSELLPGYNTFVNKTGQCLRLCKCYCILEKVYGCFSLRFSLSSSLYLGSLCHFAVFFIFLAPFFKFLYSLLYVALASNSSSGSDSLAFFHFYRRPRLAPFFPSLSSISCSCCPSLSRLIPTTHSPLLALTSILYLSPVSPLFWLHFLSFLFL